MKPLNVLAAALGAAVIGLMLGLFITGPGALLRTDLGQTLFARFVPPKYPAPGGAAEPGDAVRPFTVRGFDGRPRILPTPGRWQVINYWASWCGPCRLEMPWLDSVHAGGQGRFEVVGIALESPEAARTLLAEIPVRFSQHHEPAGPADSSVLLGNGWGILPFTVLIDPQGRLVKRHIGVFDGEAQLRDWLAEGME